ncbi:unnamed protein product [Blepharisma stoltei]|uniref:Uncharacterized protein n=1 Tax=Blepharisma stoltei TaxID=1481888 RepID=A0AAU9IY50_9CILI|nr:unnamed protein product [Blepharisma stoltei]
MVIRPLSAYPSTPAGNSKKKEEEPPKNSFGYLVYLGRGFFLCQRAWYLGGIFLWHGNGKSTDAPGASQAQCSQGEAISVSWEPVIISDELIEVNSLRNASI